MCWIKNHTHTCQDGEGEGDGGGGEQFFFDQKSLDIAERKRRQQESHGGKRNRGGLTHILFLSLRNSNNSSKGSHSTRAIDHAPR